ncbi:MAG: pyruvate ferredoxin oxidoreductase, partial [Rhodocyclaceae bacterium]|nr:pyruvate ferredoxin oxidoreductase [Rhodocyclaceae bacterium]
KQMRALELIPQLSAEFREVFGRESGGLMRTYRAEDAKTIVVALGSLNGTIKDVVDELRDDGYAIGAAAILSFRPFPSDELHELLSHAKRLVVIEKSLAVGIGGIVSHNLRMALSGISLHAYTVVAGLGGRPITKSSLRSLFERALRDELEPLTFLDLNQSAVARELEREKTRRRSGPSAENILRDIAAAGGR